MNHVFFPHWVSELISGLKDGRNAQRAGGALKINLKMTKVDAVTMATAANGAVGALPACLLVG